MPESNNKYIISIVSLVVLLFGALVFAGWAYSGKADYKNNLDSKVASAVSAATAEQKTQLDAKYANDSKLPTLTFTGPQTYGSVSFSYPRTWNALVDQSGKDQPINGYFYPGILPNIDDATPFALRLQLLGDDYATTASSFDSQIQDGSLKASAYLPPKMNGVSGAQPGLKLDGKVTADFNGSIVILKVRDKTLQLSTQSNDYSSDFTNTILASLTFNP